MSRSDLSNSANVRDADVALSREQVAEVLFDLERRDKTTST